MMRDEFDIAGYTIAHLLNQKVDSIIVADNLSSDGTSELLAGMAKADSRVCVVQDDEPAHWQGSKMTNLIAAYADPGEWVIPFDADELWTGIDKLDDLDADLVSCTPFVHVPQMMEFLDLQDEQNPYLVFLHRQNHSEPQPKVAFRYQPGVVVAEGNHQVHGVGYRKVDNILDVRHFQYRTLLQVRRKVDQGTAALIAAGMQPAIGSHWRELAAKSDEELDDWWFGYCNQPVILDPAIVD